MNLIGNVLWFILGGFVSFFTWLALGILWSITIIGYPIGRQCFKFSVMAAAPFGRKVEFGQGGVSFVLNILWIILGGFAIAIEEVTMGIVFCLTIVGIPFGLQHFKHAKLALLPFGARIVRSGR
ncbi:MAG: YccF domain-containing protein [Alkalibacterium sp.]|uniref:Uncharacterized membrane protein YccF, DUF307 family n=1 Tax=Alkalibacterium gilvum TaxID=1130080 RepID=A0A1H6UCS7_9LACT|nr:MULTISPECIES: YccF domain-containing protein [Alkalibacterium]MDN6294613.1 YccF domain-containing protein [Alkalibacterium sp.]MDN6296292.1 YccF domain-containing protein [Alkalibacterium sp.]MDN6326982.1 YccF domain-containing protein [Alkalibacterium sp.]MDN6398242.1 YccF domain-containing protein [Alkalibacterium sp.]SEI85652.1 Uncharacterized membrane protein YccF, DUF307 family [Alkalibacterium gilvum]